MKKRMALLLLWVLSACLLLSGCSAFERVKVVIPTQIVLGETREAKDASGFELFFAGLFRGWPDLHREGNTLRATMTVRQRDALLDQFEEKCIRQYRSKRFPEINDQIKAILPMHVDGPHTRITGFYVFVDEKYTEKSPQHPSILLFGPLFSLMTDYNCIYGVTTLNTRIFYFDDQTGEYLGRNALSPALSELPPATLSSDYGILMPEDKTLTNGRFMNESKNDAEIKAALAEAMQDIPWSDGVMLFRPSKGKPVTTVYLKVKADAEEINWETREAEFEKGAAAVRAAAASGSYDIVSEPYVFYLFDEYCPDFPEDINME